MDGKRTILLVLCVAIIFSMTSAAMCGEDVIPTVVILMDRSRSISYAEYESSKAQVKSIVMSVPDGTRVIVVLFSAKAEVLFDAVVQGDRTSLLGLLEGAAQDPPPPPDSWTLFMNPASVARDALDNAGCVPKHARILWITDRMQDPPETATIEEAIAVHLNGWPNEIVPPTFDASQVTEFLQIETDTERRAPPPLPPPSPKKWWATILEWLPFAVLILAIPIAVVAWLHWEDLVEWWQCRRQKRLDGREPPAGPVASLDLMDPEGRVLAREVIRRGEGVSIGSNPAVGRRRGITTKPVTVLTLPNTAVEVVAKSAVGGAGILLEVKNGFSHVLPVKNPPELNEIESGHTVRIQTPLELELPGGYKLTVNGSA